MGRHSGSAYEAAPDEWRPEGGGDWDPDKGHSPVTRRQVFGILGVAGAAAACTAGVSVVANKPDSVPGDGSMPAGAPAKPVGLAAGAAGVTAPTSDKATAKAYDKTGYRSSKPPTIQPKPLLQRPTILSLDQNLHWARRITYGVTPATMNALTGMGRERFLEQQLTVRPDPVVAEAAERYPLLNQSPTQLKRLFEGNDDRPENQRLDYLATEDQLVEMKIIRTAWSVNQLFEKTHDVWASFLHVPVGDKTRLMAADFDRNVVRKHTFGRYVDMLQAGIFHPAMLVYLDQPESNGNRKGDDGRPLVNENLGRELLELFSVGSLDPITGKANYDGKVDIRQAAYALTGLTVDRETLTTRFDPDMRYRGALKVMGWRNANTDPARGTAVIRSLLNYVAMHPATAKHIAEQFARHFVSDTPRPELISKLAAEYIRGPHGHQADAADAVQVRGLPQVGRPEVPDALGVRRGQPAGGRGDPGPDHGERDRRASRHLQRHPRPALPHRAERRPRQQPGHPGRPARLPGGLAVRQGPARPVERERGAGQQRVARHPGAGGRRPGRPGQPPRRSSSRTSTSASSGSRSSPASPRPCTSSSAARRPRRPPGCRTCPRSSAPSSACRT